MPLPEQSVPTDTSPLVDKRMGRRRFLGYLIGGGAGLLATATGIKLFQDSQSHHETHDNSMIELGNPEQISFQEFGMQWMPDAHVPYVSLSDGERVFFMSSNAQTYAVIERDGKMVPRELDENNKAVATLSPNRQEKRFNGYRAITAVFRLDASNLAHLTALTHDESWVKPGVDGSGFTASIGLVESHDGGKTWISHPQVLEASNALEPGKKVSGVGQPTALLTEVNGKPYVQVLYTYWSQVGADLIYTSRAPILDGKIGQFSHWNGSDFVTGNISPDVVKPVIQPPLTIRDSYAALASISKFGEKYICVYETARGFCITQSPDMTKWDEPQLIMKFSTPQNPHTEGQKWYSYPTLWSLDQPSDQTLSKSGYLIYSQGIWPKPQSMERKPFTLKI